jgi:quinolinate synthase
MLDAFAGFRVDRAEKLAKLSDEIHSLRAAHGDKVLLLAHHYQRPEIVRVADRVGDSFALSRWAADSVAEHVIFAGVHFMAEAADVLTGDGQTVYHPNPNSGCPMADMAEISDVERAYDELQALRPNDRIIPITYMNSTAAVKAFCGRHDGVVCTSSNAQRIFRWAIEEQAADAVLFLPDEHLGHNTARRMGIADEDCEIFHFTDRSRNDAGRLADARVILWGGFCHVHQWYKAEMIDELRAQKPGLKVVVHPECPAEVVDAADAHGSTSFICDYIENSGPGTSVAVGTELNLTQRLAEDFPDREIIPLARSVCPNMYRITLSHVRDTLRDLPRSKILQVDGDDRRDAAVALHRMLTIG